MTNYFLTNALGPSKIISPFPLLFIWYSFMCSTLSEWGTCCYSKIWNIWVIFTSPTWNTINMFSGLGGLEKGLVIDAEWNVIALLLQLSKWGGKQSFQEHKMFPIRHFADSLSICQHTFTPSIHSVMYYYTLIPPAPQTQTHSPDSIKSPSELPNTDWFGGSV